VIVGDSLVEAGITFSQYFLGKLARLI
jgi:hypothetical protein